MPLEVLSNRHCIVGDSIGPQSQGLQSSSYQSSLEWCLNALFLNLQNDG